MGASLLSRPRSVLKLLWMWVSAFSLARKVPGGSLTSVFSIPHSIGLWEMEDWLGQFPQICRSEQASADRPPLTLLENVRNAEHVVLLIEVELFLVKLDILHQLYVSGAALNGTHLLDSSMSAADTVYTLGLETFRQRTNKQHLRT